MPIRIRSSWHTGLGIVILTAQAEDDVLFQALETGVSAFVGKTAPNTEVLGAIRHAAVAAASFTAPASRTPWRAAATSPAGIRSAVTSAWGVVSRAWC